MDDVLFFPENGEINKVTIPGEINREVAENYAPERQRNASFYAKRRGGFPPSLFDCWYYKCAEFATAYYLHEKCGLPLILPDTKIYKSSEKTWNADFQFNDVNFLGKNFDVLRFHNKSFTQASAARKFPESYMFQLSNKDKKGGQDTLLSEGNDKDFCVFVYVPHSKIVTEQADFYIRSILPWNFIKENNLLEDPKKPQLIGIKLCVYTESVFCKLKQPCNTAV